MLLVFGVAALLSIWATGQFVDPHHRGLMLVSSSLLGASAAVLGVAFVSPALLYLGVAAWGLGFGGSATLFVTAGIRAAGTDGVTALVVTVFNLSIAAGGVLGGLLLSGFGGAVDPLGVHGNHDSDHCHRRGGATARLPALVSYAPDCQ